MDQSTTAPDVIATAARVLEGFATAYVERHVPENQAHGDTFIVFLSGATFAVSDAGASVVGGVVLAPSPSDSLRETIARSDRRVNVGRIVRSIRAIRHSCT